MKPGSMWGKAETAKARRFNPLRMIDEDRVLMARVGPHAPCDPKRGRPINPSCMYHLALRRDQESVTIAIWLSRRREPHSWRNGAKVRKR